VPAGGLFRTKHLAWIAERGTPEAVIPLRRSAQNLGLLDRANTALGVGSRRQSSPITVNAPITINGATDTNRVATTVRESILEAMYRARDEDYRRSFA
jgi:hypothetical protein